MTVTVTIPNRSRDIQFAQRLSEMNLALGLGDADELWEEISGYIDVLLGRVPSPIDSPYLAMMEVATAYFARAQEIDALIHKGEREGSIMKGSQLYRFRTGELRAFLELAKRCAELGSRRLTQESLLAEARRDSSL